MNVRRLVTGLGAAAALVLHVLPWGLSRGNSPVEFVVQPSLPPAATNTAPVFREETLPSGNNAPSVHVASLCEPSPGLLAAAWYGGSREGARDVAVFFATRNRQGWTEPVSVVTADSARRELGHYVRKVGNAVVFADSTGKVSLLYVAIAVGGWSGSSLCLKESFDRGRTWTPSRRLILSPTFNISDLVKNGPTPLVGGGWAVPIYQELLGKFPEVLWLDSPAISARAVRTRVFGGRTAFQPTLVALDRQRAVMLCRTAGDQLDMFTSRTEDAGASWSPPQPSGLPNSNSGIDAVRLQDGRLLLAFNDTTSGRANLRLAISRDDGKTWQHGPFLADEPGAEFSYPFLIQGRDGMIHLAYTWKREAIKVVSFNARWLDASANGQRP
ncbi:MAG TPA: exo-alpha-sialidase [Verrucomicrobiota bacterium]|nr:hypothetical protein [Verrucomicrobiales bacterium]HRI13146.1 exo-alpha-sialidase [Verrucomicrobiota bacterium]